MRYKFKNYRLTPNVSYEDRDIFKYYYGWASHNYKNAQDLNNKAQEYIRTKNKKLLNELVISAQPIVMKCAKNYSTNNQYMDYVSEGNIGLLNAINTYNGENSFSTYAVICIMRQYQNYINQSDTINYKMLSSAMYYIKNKIKEYVKITGMKPDINTIREFAKESPYEYTQAQLEYFFSTKEEIRDDYYSNVEENFELKDYVHGILRTLRMYFNSPEELRALDMFCDSLGFGEYEMNDVALGEKYGCSNNTAKRILKEYGEIFRNFILKNEKKI